ncbi:hypothetical protein ACFQ5D_13315 [Paenibacillus farraposensis]|uniref:Uncharacterized protein n=1 Tax=Paenibacillus farraposensis TaxID=2807095 RepID=A0ABW4DEU9_9BACL|nr:hypothetical protein [Paenibacillus farraposensis]MCC3379524.1 hypothetical protein [Paenibacillus farraposensis]
MKKNKLVATALSFSLLGAVVTPSAIFASSNVNYSFQEQSQSPIVTLQHLDTATLQKNLEAAQGLEKYIKPGADGLLYIDEAGKDVSLMKLMNILLVVFRSSTNLSKVDKLN